MDLKENDFQQFFIAAGMSLPSCYLTAIGGYTDRAIDSPLRQETDCIENIVSKISSIVACIRCLENVFDEPLPL
jgi:hypothetical protein